MRLADSRRFWTKVERRSDDECWPWTGALRNGYGQIATNTPDRRGTSYAHRISYELAHGPIPAGLTIDHL